MSTASPTNPREAAAPTNGPITLGAKFGNSYTGTQVETLDPAKERYFPT